MITTATVDLALGIINSAVKLGKRADLILVEQKLGDPLPIMLPPLEADLTGCRDAMKSFFSTGDGKTLLAEDKDLAKTWTDYIEAGNQGDLGKTADLATRLIKQWALFTGFVLPRADIFEDLPPELAKVHMIYFYLVDASKPGHQRSAIVDIALAAADVLLEFVGANPALFTKDPVIQKVIGTFLIDFTKGDFEKDPGYRQLFERALGSVIHTAIEHRDLMEKEKALSLFLKALANAKEADEGDFVAGLVGGKGFDKMLHSLVKTLGENLDRVTKDQVAIDIIGGILKDAAEDDVFKAILAGKDGALATVVQIALSHTAKHPVLLKKIGDDEIWHSVLKEVLKEVANSSETKRLFTEEVLGALISAALRGVAHDKELLAGGFVARLTASVADSLSTQSMKDLFGESNLKVIAAAVLESAAEHVDLLVKDDKLLASVVAAVMEEGAKGFTSSFSRDFAIDLAISAIDVVAANASAINLPGPFGEIVGTIIKELSRDDLRKNLVSGDIVEIFTDLVQIVAANPHLWEATLANGKVPASVIRSVAVVVAADPTKLLSGPVLGSLLVELLDAVSLRAKSYATITNEENRELSTLLTHTLERLKGEVGVNLGADNIVSVITQMVLDWGKNQFLAQVGDEAFESHIQNALLAA